jgi:excisionase family DNA binding protein
VEKMFYDAKEIVQITGLSRPHIYNMLKSGVIKSVKVGNRILIPIKEIEKLCNV